MQCKQDHKASHLVPSWQDIDVLQSVVAAIKRFSTDNCW